MFFYLSQYALEIAFGVSWWIMRKTTNGVYYLLYQDNSSEKIDDSYQPVLITHDDIRNDKVIDELRTEMAELKQIIIHMKNK